MVVYVPGILQAVDLAVAFPARPTVGVARIHIVIVRISVGIVGPDISEPLLLVEADGRLVLRSRYLGPGDKPRPFLGLDRKSVV